VVTKISVALWTLVFYVQVFDGVLNNVLKAGIKSEDCFNDVTGYHTVQFLFAFGSSCFERYLYCLWPLYQL